MQLTFALWVDCDTINPVDKMPVQHEKTQSVYSVRKAFCMKDANEAISQITLLKQKLHSAKVALDELNEDRNAKLQTLLQFISNLSLACKGQNLELDNRLAKLRHQLKIGRAHV